MSDLIIALTSFIIIGSIVFHLRRRRANPAVCATSPNVRGLQISCLAAQALGVQFYGRGAAIFLSAETFALVCIVVGVAGLGYASIFCDCRDEAFVKE